MKFGAQFEANIVAEWAEHYCRYKHLKHLIGRLFPQKIKKQKQKKKTNQTNTTSSSSSSSSAAAGTGGSGSGAPNRPIASRRSNDQLSDETKRMAGSGSGRMQQQEIDERSYLLSDDTTTTSSSSSAVAAGSAGVAASGGGGGGGDVDAEGDGVGEESSSTNYIINYQSDDIADRATYFGAPSQPLKSAEERRAEIMDELHAELDKVDRWYSVVERELVKSYEALKSQIESLAESHSNWAPPSDHLATAAVVGEAEMERYGVDGHAGTAFSDRLISDDDNAAASDSAQRDGAHDTPHHSHSVDVDLPSSYHTHDRAAALPMTLMGSSAATHSAATAAASQHAQYAAYYYGSSTAAATAASGGSHRSIITSGTGAAAAAFVNSVPSAHFTREAHDLKNACIRLLRKADRLVNFVAMNTTAFEKLVKNFQKRSDFNVKDEFLADMRARDFVKSHEIDENLIPATFDLFVRHFEGGNVEQAHITLLAKIPQVKEYSRSDAYVFGFKCGAIMILAIWILLHIIDPMPDSLLPPSLHQPLSPAPAAAAGAGVDGATLAAHGHSWDIDNDVTHPVFRVTGLTILLAWLWGGLVYLWSKYRVSYVFLFEFNPRTRLTHFQIFDEAANMSIFYLLNVLLFLSHHELYLGHHVPRAIYPLTIFMFLLLKLVIPFAPFAHWATRWSLLESLWNVAKSPFGRIRFRDEFIAEILTSICKILVDAQFTFCFYFIETPFGASCSSAGVYVLPIICALPFWWRMTQCLRIARDDPKRRLSSLLNAGKYLLAIGVVVMGALHPHIASLFSHGHPFRVCWVILTIITTIAFFIWDVVVDWGLFSFDNDSTSPLLRTQLMYHRPSYYYIAIVANFILRFIWVMTIIPFTWQSLPVLRHWQRIWALPVLIIIELIRRMIWGLFTVENYHLQHSARLRNSRIMPVLFDQNNSDTDFKRRANTVTGYNGVIEGLLLLAIIFVADVLGQMIAT